jgi:DNA repair photolyase
MIIRDADVLQEASRRADVGINVSIPTLDLDVWEKTEPGTAPPRQRLRAVRALAGAGVKVNVAMAPVLPGISDRQEQLEEVVRAARDAGAANVWANLLHLRSGTREHFLNHLARDWPELLARYRDLYRVDAYLPDEARAPTLQRVAELREAYGIDGQKTGLIQPAPRPEQISLFTTLSEVLQPNPELLST